MSELLEYAPKINTFIRNEYAVICHIRVINCLLLMFVIFKATAESTPYRPGYSTGNIAPTKNYLASKVCFPDSVWDSSGIRTPLTVAEKSTPYWGCRYEMCQAKVFGKIFKVQGFSDSERLRAMNALIKAMILVENGKGILDRISQKGRFTDSYLRYFSETDFSVVRDVVTWLSRLLGKLPHDGFKDFYNITNATPPTIYF